MARRSRRFGSALAAIVVKSDRDRVTGLAAEVAYFVVLSFFPGLLMAVSALSWLDAWVGGDLAERSRLEVMALLDTFLTGRAENFTSAVSDLFLRDGGGLFTTAALISILTMSNGFAAVIAALDQIDGLSERRSWWRLRLTALLLSLGSAVILVLLLAFIVLGPLLGTGQVLAEWAGLGWLFTPLWDWLRAPMALAVLALWATTIYQIAPAAARSWRSSLPGGLVAASLWLAGSYGLRTYIQIAAGINQVLGAISGGLIVLFWFYILSLVLLLGAEVNDFLARSRRS